jgi:hypothetical protein
LRLLLRRRKVAGLEGVADTTMPANLTPEYKAAEAAFRKARDPSERLESLRDMLRVIPKHKGTDHLQGDIKRIKELAKELPLLARIMREPMCRSAFCLACTALAALWSANEPFVSG